MKLLIVIVIAVLIAAALEITIVVSAQCKPISLYWHPGVGTCWPTQVRIYSIYVQAGKTFSSRSLDWKLAELKGVSIITDLLCSSCPIFVMETSNCPYDRSRRCGY
jgi:hypothetical protein